MHDDDRGYDYDLGLFHQPSSDLSDDELRVGLFVLADERDQAAESDPPYAAALNTVACVLADERDRRAALYRAMADATVGVAEVISE